jgi:hypothetical protein
MKDFELLEAAIKHENGNAATVAKNIDYNKATISLIRRGKYPGKTKLFFDALKKRYDFLANGIIKCPALKSEMHIEVCRSYRKALKEGKNLKAHIFASVKATCPFCPMYEGVKID